MLGAAEDGDVFGVALAGANFGRDGTSGGYDDLAIGIPCESLGRTDGAGAVQIVYGSRRGLKPADNQIITQAHPGILGTAKRGDEFGFCLTAYDLGHNLEGAVSADLAIGAQGERSLTWSTADQVASQHPGTKCGPASATCSPAPCNTGTLSRPPVQDPSSGRGGGVQTSRENVTWAGIPSSNWVPSGRIPVTTVVVGVAR